MWKLLCKFSFRVPHQRRGCSPSWSWSCESVHKREPSLQVWCCFQTADGPRWSEPESENKQRSCWKRSERTNRYRTRSSLILTYNTAKAANTSVLLPWRLETSFLELTQTLCKTTILLLSSSFNHKPNPGQLKVSWSEPVLPKKICLKQQSVLVVAEIPCALTWKSWGLFTSRRRFCALLSCRRREPEGEGVPVAPLWSPSGDDPSTPSPPPHQWTNDRKWSVCKNHL